MESEITTATLTHGADAVFTASAAGECENYEPLKAMGFDVSTIEEAEQISHAVYDLMTAEEKATLHWESSQDLHKPSTRTPIDLPATLEERVALVETLLIQEGKRRSFPE